MVVIAVDVDREQVEIGWYFLLVEQLDYIGAGDSCDGRHELFVLHVVLNEIEPEHPPSFVEEVVGIVFFTGSGADFDGDFVCHAYGIDEVFDNTVFTELAGNSSFVLTYRWLTRRIYG